MPTMSIVRIESAMDWVQFSAPGNTILADEMSHFAHELRQQEERAGYLAKNMAVHGYFGWSVGSVAFLVHEQRERVMLKVSSDLCAVHQAYLAALGIENGSSVTRVDLQATVCMLHICPGLLKTLVGASSQYERGARPPGQPISMGWVMAIQPISAHPVAINGSGSMTSTRKVAVKKTI